MFPFFGAPFLGYFGPQLSQVCLHNAETLRFLHDKTFFIWRHVLGNKSEHLPKVE